MEWLSKLAYKRSRAELVNEVAASYWALLTRMFDSAKDEYNRLYPPARRHEQAALATNNPNEVVLTRQGQDPQGQFTVDKGHVTVTFLATSNPQKITAIYTTTQPAVTLTVEQGPEGYGVLREDGEDLTLDQAC